MERYGQEFDRERWGGMEGESGWGGGRGQGGRGSGFGQRGGGMGGSFGGRQGSQGAGGFGGYGGGRGGMGGFGGRGGGGQQRGGSGGFSGGSEFGQGSGYGSGYGSQWGGERWGQRDDESARTRVSEIMTENPEIVTPDATLADAARKMRDLDVGIIPVVESQENRRLRGVITDRDIAIRAVAEGKDVGSTKVQDVMTTDLEICNKNDSVRDVLQVMQREQVRRVPITDREGRLVGIVAQADVAVDYLESAPRGKRDVARTLRRISEPAEPSGGTGGSAQAGGRGRSGAGRGSQQRGEE
jgi:CBS domain-containing protein